MLRCEPKASLEARRAFSILPNTNPPPLHARLTPVKYPLPVAWVGRSQAIGMNGYRFDRLKLLVVDDNAHMRKLVSAILRAFGVLDIFEAADGEKAWPMLREAQPDVVVLDWMLEGMSGLDFTIKVRTSPDTPNPFVPIIMLTGHTH